MLDFDAHVMARTELDEAALSRARLHHAGADHPLSVSLVEIGALSDTDFARMAADFLSVPWIRSVSDLPTHVPSVVGLSERYIIRAKCLPISDHDGILTVAMVNPFDQTVHKSISLATDRHVETIVIPLSIWERAMSALEGGGDVALNQLVDAYQPLENSDPSTQTSIDSDAPIVRVVNLILTRATRLNASDIHVEPFGERLQIRYRIDGMLIEQTAPPTDMKDAITSRLKIMARLNIAERRLPQDGRFSYHVEGREVDVRMSTVPTVHGESLVLRLLDKSMANFDVSTIGLGVDEQSNLLELLDRPTGMILTTGPTGSGKTTTLYSALQHLNTPDRKLISIEDPVEYQLDGVNQIPVRPEIGLGFADVLRNVLRQDPDIVMVGEMRDADTAEIAVRAAMTGHLVLSTLHTNTAPGAIIRLKDMGLERYLIAATLNAVIAQRLVRRLCKMCAGSRAATPQDAALFGKRDMPQMLSTPVGCDSCGGTGYTGRIGLFEILKVTKPIAYAIADGATEGDIAALARTEGYVSLFGAGVRAVAEGLTTPEDVARVVGVDEV